MSSANQDIDFASKHASTFVLRGIEAKSLSSIQDNNALKVLDFSSTRIKLTEQSASPSDIIPVHYDVINGISSDIRTLANTTPLIFYFPKELDVLRRTWEMLLSNARLLGDIKFEIVRDSESLFNRHQRGIIIDLYGGNPCFSSIISPLDGRRHYAGNPIRTLYSAKSEVVSLLTMAHEVETLQRLGLETPEAERSSLQLVQCSSLIPKAESTIILHSDDISEMASIQRSAVVSNSSDRERNKNRFVKKYHAEDFQAMLATPGCYLDLIKIDSQILGYLFSFIESSHLPKQGKRVLSALDAAGQLPPGNIGFAQLLHVTDTGRDYGQCLGVNMFEVLHSSMVERAAAAGNTHLACEVRSYPYPNKDAMRLYKMHGWRDSGISMLYPVDEGPDGLEYFLSTIMLKKLKD